MAPRYSEEDLIQQINNIFPDLNVQPGHLRSPTTEFTRDIIICVLNESGLKLSQHVINVSNDIIPSKSNGIVNEFVVPFQLIATARSFFDDLAEDALENPNSRIRFSLNDLLFPESRRLKYFLSHFVNYWLFSHATYQRFSDVQKEVDEKAQRITEYEEAINDYKNQNNELRKTKATSAMKAEKLAGKIEHGKEKLGKLTDDVSALTEEIRRVKEELACAKEQEQEQDRKVKDLKKTELRLKTISKAEETKLELENQMQSRLNEEEEKLYQNKDYKNKEEEMVAQEAQLKGAVSSMQVIKELNMKKKHGSNEKKSLMADCEAGHEKLETIETQLQNHQRSLESLKGEILTASARWEKNKALKEEDLAGYVDKLSTMNSAMTEDDMVSNELDVKISEMMMNTEETKENISKEKENVEKAYATLMKGYDHFQKVMNEDHEKLRSAWKELGY